MERTIVFFDSTALFSDKNLLTNLHPAYEHVVVHQTVLALKQDAVVYNAFEEALTARSIESLAGDASKIDPPVGATPEQADILGNASFFLKKHERVWIVSNDVSLEVFAASRNIKCVTPKEYANEIQETIKREKKEADEAAKRAADERSKHRATLIKQCLVGLTIVGASVTLWLNRLQLVSTVPTWGTVLGLTIAGPLLYALRGRQRLAYGVAESGIGLFTALSTVAPFVWAQLGAPQPGAHPAAFGPGSGITIVGGLYVVVRGLDNIGTALNGTDCESKWRRLSGEKKSREKSSSRKNRRLPPDEVAKIEVKDARS